MLIGVSWAPLTSSYVAVSLEQQSRAKSDRTRHVAARETPHAPCESPFTAMGHCARSCITCAHSSICGKST